LHSEACANAWIGSDSARRDNNAKNEIFLSKTNIP
jgi:hypothetical protein